MIGLTLPRIVLRPAWGDDEVDLSDHWKVATRTKSLEGNSVGQWSVTVKAPLGGRLDTALERDVRDGDWGDFDLHDRAGNRSRMVATVNACAVSGQTDSGVGTSVRQWNVSGFDWGWHLVRGQIRLSAVFASAQQQVDAAVSDSATLAAAVSALAAGPVGVLATAAAVLSARAEADALKDEGTAHVRVPGFVDETRWGEFVDRVMKGLAGLDTNARGKARADVTLRGLVSMLLEGLFLDSVVANGTLRSKLSWERFGERPVYGAPWTLSQVVGQKGTTIDSLLRTYGCEAFNEVYYDYDKAGDKPAIVYRPRPYAGAAWDTLPTVTLDPEQQFVYNLGRSGDQRGNYWRPSTALAMASGYDALVDTKRGLLPVLDRRSIARHGVLPVEIPDDFYPPGDDSSIDDFVLAHYEQRVLDYRDWHYNDPEYLSGTVTMGPADPRIRIGHRLVIPVPFKFRVRTREIPADRIVAYVTGVQETLTCDDDGRVTSSQTVRVSRGQPMEGLPVPAAIPWRGE